VEKLTSWKLQGPDLVPTRLQRHTSQRPDHQIVSFLDEEGSVQRVWTFGELDRRARSIAAYLQSLALAGRPVVVVFPSGLDFIAAFCGCLYAGAIAVPTSLPRPHGTDERMQAILEDSGARYILTSSRHRKILERHVPAGSGISVVATDTLADGSDDWKPVQTTSDQLAFVQYTSGSTRTPRGVMISHGNFSANLESLQEMLRTSSDSVGVSWLPLFHDMGLIAGVFEPLWVGYPVYLMAPATFIQSPLRWLQAISRFRGTVCGGPNFAYQACADAAKTSNVGGMDLSCWELAWNGAEPVRASTLSQFNAAFGPAGFRAESLTPSFGLAEATLLVTSNNGTVAPRELLVDEPALRNGHVLPCGEGNPNAKRRVGSGRPDSRTDVRIVQPETLREVDKNAVGEIWVRNSSVGQGYWKKPEESASVFGARLESGEGPFLRTGDLGFLHEGELFVTGRLKDVLVIRGVNYYPEDIEYTIESSHATLRPDASAVVGLEHGGSVQLIAVLEVRRDFWRTLDANEVFEHIRRAVAREHQLALHGIVLLKPFGLPKTSSGKIRRARCRSLLEEQGLPVLHEWYASGATGAPIDFNGEPLTHPGVLERRLMDWLQRELVLSNLSWKTPLMDLGIDSLRGVELAQALATAFNYSFPPTLLIEYPTIEALASAIRYEVLGAGAASVSASRPKAEAVLPPEAVLSDEELSSRIEAMEADELDAALEKSIASVLSGSG
jgi:acyl-CoA synthetase (AMP-forming)/AMP-acid ligase II/acyl carrier protein